VPGTSLLRGHVIRERGLALPERVESAVLRQSWLYVLGSTTALVALLSPWLRRFAINIFAWWLRLLSSKLTGKKLKIQPECLEMVSTSKRVGIHSKDNDTQGRIYKARTLLIFDTSPWHFLIFDTRRGDPGTFQTCHMTNPVLATSSFSCNCRWKTEQNKPKKKFQAFLSLPFIIVNWVLLETHILDLENFLFWNN